MLIFKFIEKSYFWQQIYNIYLENRQPMNKLKIAFASDHAGFLLKKYLIKKISDMGIYVQDFGCNSEQSCDYPDFAHTLAQAIEIGNFDFGISICGSGNGINMTVNKHQKIRGALCWNEEIAKLARLHNDANVCSIPARFVSQEIAEKIVMEFIHTKFEGGRHQLRIDKIAIK